MATLSLCLCKQLMGSGVKDDYASNAAQLVEVRHLGVGWSCCCRQFSPPVRRRCCDLSLPSLAGSIGFRSRHRGSSLSCLRTAQSARGRDRRRPPLHLRQYPTILSATCAQATLVSAERRRQNIVGPTCLKTISPRFSRMFLEKKST